MKHKFMLKKYFKKEFILALILLLALFFRLIGLNWDQNHHLHPDERFLTMVVGAVEWPTSVSEYLDPNKSSLNPYNNEYGFFVYGTLPLKIIKLASQIIVFEKYDYNNITLVGRLFSVFLELGIVFLVYKISKRIFNKKTALLASFFYSISVLPIQLAHFFAVDTYLVFFTVLAFNFLLLMLGNNKKPSRAIAMGISFGLALASKITAFFFLPIIGLGFLYMAWKKKFRLLQPVILFLLFILSAYIILRLADPRIFASANFFNLSLNPQFINNLKSLKAMSGPDAGFPPSVQWLQTKPMIFPLKNLVLWGFGIPLSILVLAGLFYAVYKIIKRASKLVKLNYWFSFLIITWSLFVFIYQGVQFTKAMRYFYPIYPFLVMLAANFTYIFLKKYKQLRLLFIIYFLILFIYPLSFLSIYTKPHSRVQASEWIYKNVPKGSYLSCEHWDDCLPASIKEKNSLIYQYQTKTLELYHPDSDKKKWPKIKNQLKEIDFLIMSSNRLWASIPKAPERYPRTIKFYNDLFNERLNFTKVADITSYPCFPPIGKAWFCFPDQSVDESFTVFDHPQVLIYKKGDI